MFGSFTAPVPPASVLLGNRIALDAGNATSYPGTGTSWFDLSGNSSTLTLSSQSWSSAQGGYFTFGTMSAIAPSNYASLNITGLNLSCEFWIKVNTLGDYVIVWKAPFSGGTPANDGNYGLVSSNDAAKKVNFVSASGSGVNVNNLVGNATQDLNWHQFVFVYNNGDGTFYKDGAAITTTGTEGSSLFATAPLQAPARFRLGKTSTGNRAFIGRMSVVNLWDYALTSAQVASNYNYYAPRYV
jgi:hypothetical protein